MTGYGPWYPDDITGPAVCAMEGCAGNGHCPRCGETNYALLGFRGAMARLAKKWGLATIEEAEKRWVAEALAAEEAEVQP